MIIVEYVPKFGKPLADGDADEVAADIININQLNTNLDEEYSFSTENIFYSLRIAVKQGRLSPYDIKLKYKGQIIELDRNGRMLGAVPYEFMTWIDSKLLELL